MLNFNIKSVIASQKVRHQLLKMFSWVPDRIMLPIQYYLIFHRRLHLSAPKRWTEKIQYYKAYYRNEQMRECVDKYTVRNYVKSRMGDDSILNELYQVCNSASEIDFDTLPNKFVIKSTDGSNGDNIYICSDKSAIDIAEVRRIVGRWKNRKLYLVSREWAYSNPMPPKIIVEKLLEAPNTEDGGLIDYKFLCFDGKMYYFWLDVDRFTKHSRVIFNANCECTDKRIVYQNPSRNIKLPYNIKEMIQVAEKLSEGFPFARVDLYNISGQIVFGEITFYPESGYASVYPDSFDYELGSYFNLKWE